MSKNGNEWDMPWWMWVSPAIVLIDDLPDIIAFVVAHWWWFGFLGTGIFTVIWIWKMKTTDV